MDNLISEEKKIFEGLLDSAPDGIVVIDNNGEIIIFNKQAEHLFGYEYQEMIGQKLEGLLPHRYRVTHEHHVTNFLHSPGVRNMGASNREFFGLHKNGKEFPIDISLNYLPTGSGNIAIASIRDITEKKEINQQLLDTMQTLQSANKELEQFAYIASHDLQEPLRTISSFTELLAKEYEDKLSGNGEKYLEFIMKSSERMKVLVKGLLDYSRIGKEKLAAETDCNQLINDVLADLDTAIKECNAHIQVQQLPILNAYPTELRQLFQNLISNALKYRDKGVEPEIKITVEELPMHWQFAVQDNGIGINESDKEKIFVIFKRLHNRNDYEGSGIGLSHCKKIAELHGGKIWVESTPAKGSTFYFTILKK